MLSWATHWKIVILPPETVHVPPLEQSVSVPHTVVALFEHVSCHG